MQISGLVQLSLGKMLEASSEPVYDYVFIHRAHTWAVDALTSFLVDQLLKRGGCIDFDDYEWTLGNSPSLKPSSFPSTRKSSTPMNKSAHNK